VTNPDPDPQPTQTLLTVAEVAERLRVSLNTVRRWRQRGIGPSFVMVGKHLVTTSEDLDAWAERGSIEGDPHAARVVGDDAAPRVRAYTSGQPQTAGEEHLAGSWRVAGVRAATRTSAGQDVAAAHLRPEGRHDGASRTGLPPPT
jgi:excisionase family DNA binding protein